MATVPSVDGRGLQSSEAESSPAISVFPNAQGQTIGNIDIQTAGRDFHMQNFNLTVQYSPTVLHPQVVVEEFGNRRTTVASEATLQRSIGFSIVDVCQIVSNAVTCWIGDRETESSISVRSLNAGMDLPPSLVTTYAEVYVRGLLHSGHGLPCWEPAPHDCDSEPNGVVPGDVGTYTIDRSFRKIFNLWEDEEAIRSLAAICSQGSYRPLQGQITKERVLNKGETIRDGAYLTSPASAPSLEEVAVVHEFICHSTPGAILAMISSAELVATNDINAMRTYILQHAEAIYRRANSIRIIGGRESLYIITGSVKTDAWAMAAYREHMQPPHNVLQLVRNPPSVSSEQTPSSSYQWTKQGSAHARLGDSSDTGSKNQSIFLQGFKMALAPRFRSRVKESTLTLDVELSDTAGGKSQGEDTFPSPGEEKDQSSGVGSDPTGRSGFGSWTLSLDGLDLPSATAKPDEKHSPEDLPTHGEQPLYTPFPRVSETGYHPSDFINSQLLQSTSADAALCHDDDWRFLFQSCHSDSSSGSGSAPPHVLRSQERLLSIQNGVACTWPPEDGRRFLQLNAKPVQEVSSAILPPLTVEQRLLPEPPGPTTLTTEPSSTDEPRSLDHSSMQPEIAQFPGIMQFHDPASFTMEWGDRDCGG